MPVAEPFWHLQVNKNKHFCFEWLAVQKKKFELLSTLICTSYSYSYLLDPVSLTIRATKEYQRLRIQAGLSSGAHDFGWGECVLIKNQASSKSNQVSRWHWVVLQHPVPLRICAICSKNCDTLRTAFSILFWFDPDLREWWCHPTVWISLLSNEVNVYIHVRTSASMHKHAWFRHTRVMLWPNNSPNNSIKWAWHCFKFEYSKVANWLY